MNFEFECGWCGADCVVWGRPTGWFRELYRVDDEWECWNCEGTNITPAPPWTPAD